jgi:hypothetical protein
MLPVLQTVIQLVRRGLRAACAAWPEVRREVPGGVDEEGRMWRVRGVPRSRHGAVGVLLGALAVLGAVVPALTKDRQPDDA